MSTKRIKLELGTMDSLQVLADDEEFSLETRDASPIHFLTKIKSFSLLSKHGISEIESMEFQAGGYTWKLIMYPDGDDKAMESGHISVYLSMVGTTSKPESLEVNAIVNLFLYNHISDNYLCFRGKARRFHAVNSKWGISKFMNKKRFTDPSHGYLSDDNCVFGAEVFVLKNQRVIENVSVLTSPYPFKREWKISEFSQQKDVWNSEEFSAEGFKWKIELHPNGDTRVKGRYISIYLHCVDSKSFAANKKVKATCHFTVRNRAQYEKNHYEEVSEWHTSSQAAWGYSEFMAIGEASKGFIVDDSFVFEIQLSVEVIQEPLKLE